MSSYSRSIKRRRLPKTKRAKVQPAAPLQGMTIIGTDSRGFEPIDVTALKGWNGERCDSAKSEGGNSPPVAVF